MLEVKARSNASGWPLESTICYSWPSRDKINVGEPSTGLYTIQSLGNYPCAFIYCIMKEHQEGNRELFQCLYNKEENNIKIPKFLI